MSVTFKRLVNGQIVHYKMSLWDAFKGVPGPRRQSTPTSVGLQGFYYSKVLVVLKTHAKIESYPSFGVDMTRSKAIREQKTGNRQLQQIGTITLSGYSLTSFG
jgi:hypothetical protein